MDAEKYKIIFRSKPFTEKGFKIFTNYCAIFIWLFENSAIIFVPVL